MGRTASCEQLTPMSPVVLKLTTTEDPRDAVHRAVQALAEGQVVALPTETVYGLAANALCEQAVAQLLEVKGRTAGHPLSLSIRGVDDAIDYVPNLCPLAKRLARRCWPGPVTLVLDDDHPESVVRQLPPAVRQAVIPGGTVGLRVPDHPVMLSVLRLSAGPLVLTSANRTGNAAPVTAEDVLQELGEQVHLVLDDGPCRFAAPSSVVRVHNQGLEVLRKGVVSEQTLRRLSSLMVLLVCTGNTCRSPMAEAILRGKIASQLNCGVDDLESRGVMIMSAGIAAMAGGRSSPEALEAMRDRGLDLSQHESQPLSDRLVRFADLILTMTRGHREAIAAQWPEAASRTELLARDHGDIADPIGGPSEIYRRCADQIDTHLEGWIRELDLAGIPAMNNSGD